MVANRALVSPAGAPRGATLSSSSICPIFASVEIIGTKWRLMVVRHLLQGPKRYNELLRANPGLNAKTLSSALKFLERARVLERHVITERPVQVVYSLTADGRALGPVIEELRAWGERRVMPRWERRDAQLRAIFEGKALQ
ncbi:MAG: helix-turn-helix transcriptional regulator [Euryarchaeota archaeon]|nr:helix-turn-helix transcriptional regulator [Euryarchaeota archaeon]MDE1837653.1 helix-turn-helix transcriptional regulator [Euryarchaeota archaeon]MDE1880327.1 helix-turn-helix transcriptional regulator [Euryarchaeota archaeon]MDE2046270.1 helix-turn-helix transcriptional regulator [Thermoplasmata archaeon]